MKKLRSKYGLVAAGLCICLAAGPAAAAVIVSFSGTVEDVTAFGATPPAGVSIGDPVSGIVSYAPRDGQGVETEPSDWNYAFNPGDVNVVHVTIGTQTWTTSLIDVHVCDGVCTGDELGFGGITFSASEFPGMLDNGVISLQYIDSAEPYDLISGIDLPNSTDDVDFGAVEFTTGAIGSTSTSGIWAITFTADSSTLPVTKRTWSQVKQLFARP